jgi:hypothetical protein
MTIGNDPDEIRADIERTRAATTSTIWLKASSPRTWPDVRSAKSRRLRATSRSE